MNSEMIDLGSSHTLRFTRWAPDRELNPQYADLPDVDPYGAIISHPPGPHPLVPSHLASGMCEGMVTFDGEVQRRLDPDRPRWTVESLEPLTLSPSVLCACGDHGYVRDGRWVTA